MVRRMIAAALPFLAIGCATSEAQQIAPAFVGESALYRCADGRDVEIIYGGGAAVLTIAGQPVQMTAAASASGVRYIGGGWQWWSKGLRDGALAPLAAGEDVASAAGVRCAVR